MFDICVDDPKTGLLMGLGFGIGFGITMSLFAKNLIDHSMLHHIMEE